MPCFKLPFAPNFNQKVVMLRSTGVVFKKMKESLVFSVRLSGRIMVKIKKDESCRGSGTR